MLYLPELTAHFAQSLRDRLNGANRAPARALGTKRLPLDFRQLSA
jgi:hypothetical protein